MPLSLLTMFNHGGCPPKRLVRHPELSRGVEAWTLMRDTEAWHATPEGSLADLQRNVPRAFDVAVVLPSEDSPNFNGRCLEAISKLRTLGTAILVWDTNYFHDYHQKTPKIAESVFSLFDAADAVLIRHPRAVALAQALTSTPCVEWYDVAPSATEQPKKVKPGNERTWVVCPSAFSNTERHNERRGDAVNQVVLQRLQQDFPLLNYGIVAQTHTPTVIEERTGADLFPTNLGRKTNSQILKVMQCAKLLVNLDAMDAGGFWTVDAAACGTPSITTSNTTAGYLCGQSVAYPYDVEEAVEVAHNLLTDDEAWQTASDSAKAASANWTAPNVHARLMKLLKDIGKA